jgi:hypothetical protein
VVTDLVRELVDAMGERNRARAAADRVRLRLALHLGGAHVDETAGVGVEGSAAAVTSRLVDAPPLGRLLYELPAADLALIVSSALFEATVRPGLRGLDPRKFRRVDVDIPTSGGTAWVGAPGPGSVPDPARDRPAGSVPAAASGIRSWDFLVSVADEDGAWGEWLAWELEGRGHQVHLQAWDVVAGHHQVNRLHEAVSHARRTLVVLTEDYLRAPRMQAEWTAAWEEDPAGMNRRLIPVRVAECRPEGLLRGITYIDLVGLDDDAARATFHRGIEASILGRYRPTSPPPYPGTRARS